MPRKGAAVLRHYKEMKKSRSGEWAAWVVRLVAVGTRHIDDDSLGLVADGVGFVGDGTVGVEELVGDVGQDSGAARGDGTFGDELEEAGEKLVDVDTAFELGELGEELGGEVEGIIWRLMKARADGGTCRQVVEAKTQMGTGGEFPAALAVGEKVLATTLFWSMWQG